MKELVYNPKTKAIKFCNISTNHFRNKCIKYKDGRIEPLFETSAVSLSNAEAGSRECDVYFLTMKGSKKLDQAMIELIKKAQERPKAYMQASNNNWFFPKA